MRQGWIAAALLVMSAGLAAQQPAELDVISVRPNPSPDPFAGGLSAGPGRFSERRASVEGLVARAYGLPMMLAQAHGWLIEGWPDDTLRHARYDIQITTRPRIALSRAEWALMLRAALEARFGLRAHVESRPRPVYAVRLAEPGRVGPNLQRRAPCDAEGAPSCRAEFDILPDGSSRRVQHGPIELLLAAVQGAVTDRLVVDQTGLEGTYTWELTSPSLDLVGRLPRGTAFLSGLEDGLGLVVVPTEADVDVVVIDAIHAPEPN